jgi:sugar O-acyltransferase (sialic acid O-acetyltransferase NeuD family)
MKVIFGSSGFAKEVHLIIRRVSGEQAALACFVCSDDDLSVATDIKGVPVMRESEFFEIYKAADIEIYIGVGSPRLRQKIYQKIKNWNSNAKFPILIDPHASMDLKDNNITIGQGVVICAGVAITTDITIGDFTHVNLNCTVGHDAEISEFSTLSPAVNISGKVKVGARTFFGTGAIVAEGLSIAEDSVIGAGAVLLSSITEPGVYVGMPAKLKTKK